jgi:anti-sigma regulatory factor (Ser/Thr protein kinase)
MDARRWSHSRTWAAEPLYVARARDFVSEHLRAHGLAEIVDSAQLVVSELATNAVVHTGMPFTVTLRRLDLIVVLLVADSSELTPQVQPSRTLPTSGMGLHVVGAVSDSWGVQAEPAGGKSVWASFDVVPPVVGLPVSGGDGHQLGTFDL